MMTMFKHSKQADLMTRYREMLSISHTEIHMILSGHDGSSVAKESRADERLCDCLCMCVYMCGGGM